MKYLEMLLKRVSSRFSENVQLLSADVVAGEIEPKTSSGSVKIVRGSKDRLKVRSRWIYNIMENYCSLTFMH